jgi:hypothetical protein
MGRAHNLAIDMHDKMMASELQQSKWESMSYPPGDVEQEGHSNHIIKSYLSVRGNQ